MTSPITRLGSPPPPPLEPEADDATTFQNWLAVVLILAATLVFAAGLGLWTRGLYECFVWGWELFGG